MRVFLRVLLLVITLTLSGAFGVEDVQAQTREIREKLTGQLARSLADECWANLAADREIIDIRQTCGDWDQDGGDLAGDIIVRDPSSGITARCNRGLSTQDRATCVFTAPDGSNVTSDPNDFNWGSVDTWRDSSGAVIQESNTGLGQEDDGTGNLMGARLCTEGSLSDCIRNLPGMIMVGFATLFLTLAGMILLLAGVVFNFVVIRTVFQFGEYFGTSEGMLLAWGIMRDVANIGLLFGFILMGVLLILNVEGGAHGHGGGISAKKAIPKLIIFAVLLNFSLFASQIVIDVANAFGSSFATLAGEECANTANEEAAAGGSQADCVNNGISGKILAASGVSGIWDAGNRDTESFTENSLNNPYGFSVSLIMLSIFVIITAMVLLAGAIMLIIRVVTLSLLMVTSPIGFAGLAIPKLEGIAKMWWSKLMSQAFFAPIYLLLIFISIKLTEGLMGDGASLANAMMQSSSGSVSGNLQVVMVFLIVIGFMIGALLAATKMGAIGASFAANSASALVFGAAARGTNFAAGGTGRLGRFAMQRLPGDKKAAWRSGMTNLAFRPLEKANLDLRRIPGASAGLGIAGISAGAKAAEHATYGDIVHQFDDIKSAKGRKARTEEYNEELKNQALERNAHGGSMTNEDKAHLASLSTKELEQLHGIKEGVQQLAENLSSEQFAKLMEKDSKLTDQEKGKLKAARFKALNDADAVAKNPPNPVSGQAAEAEVKRLLKGMTKKDLSTLPPSLIASPVVLNQLSDSQRDDLVKEGGRAPAEIAAIKASYASEILKGVYTTGGAAAVLAHPKYRNLPTKQFAKLGANALSDPAIAANIPAAVLDKIVKEDELEPQDLKRIGAAMRTAQAAGTASPAVMSYLASPKAAFYL